MSKPTREGHRLEEARHQGIAWRKWGPYLSERQWGSVRENTNRQIEAWNDLTHDQSRSRAYQSGEDGIAGFCDENMLLCFSVAMWNGKDPILKERMFGLTNSEGNHGEDVKEYYFYLDSTPTHSYAKMLYKYPQAEFPYYPLVAENRRRTRNDFEFELLDTGIFDENRYFDVFVEYAKVDPEDILIRVSAVNRGPDAAPLHLLPHLWFRNTWCIDERAPRPELEALHHPRCAVIAARHPQLGQRFLYCEGAGELLFADNETNRYRLWGQSNPTPYQKDGINDYVVQGRRDAVNPAKKGTKSAAHTLFNVAPGQTVTMRLRLTTRAPENFDEPMAGFDGIFAERLRDADEFYAERTPPSLSPDAAQVVRQGAAGLLWTKQAYVYDVEQWLHQRGVQRDSDGRDAESALVPHVQRRRDLDAGQVGVSLVRGLGSGVPFGRARRGRSRSGRATAGPDVARPVSAPERSTAGLRVELRRRQSAGPRLGDDLQLPAQSRHPRRAARCRS